MQLAAMNADLRCVVAGVEAAQLLPHGLAEAIGVDELARSYAGGIQGRQQAERRQFLDGVRQHVDADAKLAQLARLLVDLRFDADVCRARAAAKPPMPPPAMTIFMTLPIGIARVDDRRTPDSREQLKCERVPSLLR